MMTAFYLLCELEYISWQVLITLQGLNSKSRSVKQQRSVEAQIFPTHSRSLNKPHWDLQWSGQTEKAKLHLVRQASGGGQNREEKI